MATDLAAQRVRYVEVARNAVAAAFLDEPGKARIIGAIDDVLAAHLDGA